MNSKEFNEQTKRRSDELLALDMKYDGQTFYGNQEINKDFNVHWTELATKTDVEWVQLISHLKIERLGREKKALELQIELYKGVIAPAIQLTHLHLCEQEGIVSGQPTRDQWLRAVDELNAVLDPFRLTEQNMFRKLDNKEDAEFRQWARDNYKPNTEISSIWHPVVRDECNKINKESMKGG